MAQRGPLTSKRDTGIPNTTLAHRLIDLEKLGLITKHVKNSWPRADIEYIITSLGVKLGSAD